MFKTLNNSRENLEDTKDYDIIHMRKIRKRGIYEKQQIFNTRFW